MNAGAIPFPSRTTRLLLFTVALSLRLGYMGVRGTLGVTPSLERGYREYVMAGERLLRYGTITSPLILDEFDPRPSSLMPPAYVGLVAGVYKLLGIETRAATLFLQVVNASATALAVVVVFMLAGELAGGKAAWIAAATASLNPTLIGYTDFIWDTSLFTLGATIAVWWSDRLGRMNPSPRSWFAFGFYLGALALLNPALTATYPLLVLWPLARRSAMSWHSIAGPIGLTIAGWTLAIAPWTIRNDVQFGEWTYVRGGLGIELWLGSCPEADAEGVPVLQAQFPLNNPDIQSRVAEIGERAFIHECGLKARLAIAADPWRFIRLSGIRLIDHWCGTTFSHAAPSDGTAPRLTLRNGITAFLSVELLVVVGAILLPRGLTREVWWLLGIGVVFGVIYTITHVQLRYRAPIEPVMAVIVGLLLSRTSGRSAGAAPARTPSPF